MQKIEWLLHFLYYFIRQFHISFQLSIINGFVFLFRFNLVVKFCKLLGVADPIARAQEITPDLLHPEKSVAGGQADGHISGLIFLLYMFITMPLLFQFKPSYEAIALFVGIDAIAGAITANYLIFRKKKYKKNFKQFDKWQGTKRKIYRWIATIIILMWWSLFYLTWVVTSLLKN